jgi:hypothetical protein
MSLIRGMSSCWQYAEAASHTILSSSFKHVSRNKKGSSHWYAAVRSKAGLMGEGEAGLSEPVCAFVSEVTEENPLNDGPADLIVAIAFNFFATRLDSARSGRPVEAMTLSISRVYEFY